MLQFPRVGTFIRVPLFTPEHGAPEMYQGVEVEVELLAREKILVWAAAAQEVHNAELARNPDGKIYSTEAVKGLRANAKQIITDAVKAVHGVQVGDVDLGSGIARDLLAQCLDEAGLLLEVANAAERAQRPTPVQKKLSGSPPATDPGPS